MILISKELNYFLKNQVTRSLPEMRGKCCKRDEAWTKFSQFNYNWILILNSYLLSSTFLPAFLALTYFPPYTNPPFLFFPPTFSVGDTMWDTSGKSYPFSGENWVRHKVKNPGKIIYKFLLPQIPRPKNFTRDLYLKIKFYSKKSPETRRLPQIFTPKPG